MQDARGNGGKVLVFHGSFQPIILPFARAGRFYHHDLPLELAMQRSTPISLTARLLMASRVIAEGASLTHCDQIPSRHG